MTTHELWGQIAARAVEGLGVQPGEVVNVRDGAGRYDVLQEMLLAVERAGATPMIDVMPASYLRRLIAGTPRAHLASWDTHRAAWLRQADRILVLGGTPRETRDLPAQALHAWDAASQRLTALEEERRLPFLLLGVPTQDRADLMGLSLDALEAMVLPALNAPAHELQGEVARMLAAIGGRRRLILRTGVGCALELDLGKRVWMNDDGAITPDDQLAGAIVSNLPAGSIYTTVVESATTGNLLLPRAGEATDVTLRFEQGRVVEIEAASGAESLNALFDRHSGEPRRIGHIGIGLNPYLSGPIDWTLIDEHVHGYLFISFGENRYMGGQNESSLNIDFAVPGAMLLAGDTIVVAHGKVAV